MADVMTRILGPDGRPVRKQELTREAAHPTLTGVRQVWNGESMASGLTPERLAALLRSAAEGSQRDFLTLAEEMEERDPHYGAVLGVRKRAVSGLEPTVEAASDEGSDVELADAVREIVKRPEFGEMLDDCLDELGKGYSAVEIIWDRSGSEWRPKRYAWRDSRFFVFDRNDGRTLRLLDEAGTFQGIPLEPYKWIVHMPRLKSGLPARGGLARLVALAYMVKAYVLTDWVAFAEVFGMPLRLGRYGPGATESDIGKLMRAVANLGTDAAAVLPETMRIEFVEGGNRAGAGVLFEKLAIYLDRQIAKAVLGQTATTEGTPGKLGNEEAQDKVRQDILRSDARQLENTLNRDLVRPFIDLNHGPQKSYPRLLLLVREPEDIQALTAALEKLTPLGLRVEASVIRDKLGLPDPADDSELLGPPVERRNAGPESASNRAVVHRERIEANAESPSRPDAVEALLDEELEDWEEMVRPLVDPVEKLLSESRDLKQFRDKLAEVISRMDPLQLADLLARAGFATRAAGEAGADLG